MEFMRLEPVRKVCRSALIVKYQSDSFAALRRTFRLNGSLQAVSLSMSRDMPFIPTDFIWSLLMS